MSKELVTIPSLPFTVASLLDKHGRLSLNPQVIQDKADIIAEADPIINKEIKTISDRDAAINVAARLAGMVADAEKDRKAQKQAFYDMGVAIDATASAYKEDLEFKKVTINRKVGAFNEAEKERQRKEQAEIERKAREAREEIERIEKDKLKKEQEAREHEEATGKPLSKKLEAKLLQEQLEADEKQEQLAAETKRLEDLRIQNAELSRSSRSVGGSQRTEIVVEVWDKAALYKARPDCVRLEPDLIQIKYLITTHKDDPTPYVIPGVTYQTQPVFSAKKR